MCVCVCVCVWRVYTYTYTHTPSLAHEHPPSYCSFSPHFYLLILRKLSGECPGDPGLAAFTAMARVQSLVTN